MDGRDELARLLLARHNWAQEIKLARVAIRQIDKEIQAIEAVLDDDDICGHRMASGYCGKPAGHEESGTSEGRRHRSAEAIERKRVRRAGGTP
jgi:hypothetical protein